MHSTSSWGLAFANSGVEEEEGDCWLLLDWNMRDATRMVRAEAPK